MAEEASSQPQEAPAVDVLIEDGLRKAINGYTWPGIEYGEPPSCPHTFFEYVDALRLNDLAAFRKIEAACEGWYSIGMDRGAGAALHFAVDHGRLEVVKFLVEQRGAAVNQRDAGRGWTPLMRCARMAHYKHAPYLQVFEYLLQKGGDPSIRSFVAPPPVVSDDPGVGPTGHTGLQAQDLGPAPPLLLPGQQGGDVGIMEVAAEKGFGWAPGAVRAELARLIERYKDVPKAPAHVYTGPQLEAPALALLAAWESLPKLYPPANWRPPPPPGYINAKSVRLAAAEPWRPAGDNDGSAFLRPMTEAELAEQAANC